MDNNLQMNQSAEQTYHSIRQSIVSAQHKLNAAVNSAMVITYGGLGNRFIKRVEKMTEQHTEKICWTIFQLN